MFAYLSHLVQARKFTQIRVSFLLYFYLQSFPTKFVPQINFLVVGHTHCPLDQYFSVLSKAILKAIFIASPEALMELFDTAHKIEVADQLSGTGSKCMLLSSTVSVSLSFNRVVS